ncbi:MAG: hypothetical protein ABUL61_02940, partial [Oleiharenicola lentus]
PVKWPAPATLLAPALADRLDLTAIREEQSDLPVQKIREAKVLTDDFAPVEFLDTVKTNNSSPR